MLTCKVLKEKNSHSMMLSTVLVSVVTTRNPSAHVMPKTGRSTNVARNADLEFGSRLQASITSYNYILYILHYGTFNPPLYSYNINHCDHQDNCVDLRDVNFYNNYTH